MYYKITINSCIIIHSYEGYIYIYIYIIIIIIKVLYEIVTNSVINSVTNSVTNSVANNPNIVTNSPNSENK